jgi:hypothetical protein
LVEGHQDRHLLGRPGHEESWRADAVTWSEHNTEAFAGLHNKGKRIVVITDESSKIADKVWEVIEGALTDEETEILWLVYGNPTQQHGRFRECFGKHPQLWKTRQIDSRDGRGHEQGLPAVDHRHLRRGQRHRQGPRAGQFPSAHRRCSSSRRPLWTRPGSATSSRCNEPLMMGVDVARFGDDRTRRSTSAAARMRGRFRRSSFTVDTMQLGGQGCRGAPHAPGPDDLRR